MFIFPNTFILSLRHFKNGFKIGWITTYGLLNKLLDSQCAIHLFKRLIWPTAKVLEKCDKDFREFGLQESASTSCDLTMQDMS